MIARRARRRDVREKAGEAPRLEGLPRTEGGGSEMTWKLDPELAEVGAGVLVLVGEVVA